jgi:CYTH domain-containing protein
MLEKFKFEIERKWLLSSLPDVAAGITPIEYERYFLPSEPAEEIRIQKVGEKYTYQKKIEVPGVGRERVEDREISEEEFLNLKKGATGSILRTRYDLAPNVSIQVYHGKHEGLIRYEVEFQSVDESEAFQPEPWVGREITDSPLGRDSRLLSMSDEEFQKELENNKSNE